MPSLRYSVDDSGHISDRPTTTNSMSSIPIPVNNDIDPIPEPNTVSFHIYNRAVDTIPVTINPPADPMDSISHNEVRTWFNRPQPDAPFRSQSFEGDGIRFDGGDTYINTTGTSGRGIGDIDYDAFIKIKELYMKMIEESITESLNENYPFNDDPIRIMLYG